MCTSVTKCVVLIYVKMDNWFYTDKQELGYQAMFNLDIICLCLFMAENQRKKGFETWQGQDYFKCYMNYFDKFFHKNQSTCLFKN